MEKELIQTKRLCGECNAKLIGRKDKKFCSDQCRTSYFNRMNSDQSKFMKNINNILRKNRKILESLVSGRSCKVQKVELLDEGFRFSYFTNEYITKTGKTYRFCYEYGYVPVDINTFMIVQRKEYID
jgi:hypothetical protein